MRSKIAVPLPVPRT